MLLLATLFVLLIIAAAFVVNSMLDRRAERRATKGETDGPEQT